MALDLQSYRARAQQGGRANLAMAGVSLRFCADRPEIVRDVLGYFAPVVTAAMASIRCA